MKVFLSASDVSPHAKATLRALASEGVTLRYNLISYYYSRSDEEFACFVRDHSALLMVDSGAHTLQKNAKVSWRDYTEAYAEFISRFDRPNVVGYFEMDVDNIIGYDRVLELREILHRYSGNPDKIIPVWHRNRGVEEFKKMCRDRSGRVAAVTGFKNEDIKDEQYLMFLKYAKSCNCRLHCLGMTRKNILAKVPFDYVDSSSWAQGARFGRVQGRKVKRPENREDWLKSFRAAYLEGMAMADRFERMWSGIR